jgi:hypothetical protein
MNFILTQWFAYCLQGNGATGNCCSKCWRDLQKKQGISVDPKPVAKEPAPEPVDVVMEDVRPMEIEETSLQPVVENKKPAAPAQAPKKKKKTSYKAMMAGIVKSSPERDIEKEKESLRKVVGGGAFSKIDKI